MYTDTDTCISMSMWHKQMTGATMHCMYLHTYTPKNKEQQNKEIFCLIVRL